MYNLLRLEETVNYWASLPTQEEGEAEKHAEE